MSALPPNDRALSPPPGGMAVADLRAMEGEQALAVMMLRDWFDGPDGQARVADTLCTGLGPEAGQAGQSALAAWEAFCDLIACQTRRPILRHDLTCRCVGSDEAVLAQALGFAATGEREEAMLILSLLVPADRLLPAVTILARAGLALKQIATRWRLDPLPSDQPRYALH